MNDTASPTTSKSHSLVVPILVGGFVAGVFDAIAAIITFGWGMSRGIASGLLGTRAFTGGIGTWLLGLALHFFIAVSAAAIYCYAVGIVWGATPAVRAYTDAFGRSLMSARPS